MLVCVFSGERFALSSYAVPSRRQMPLCALYGLRDSKPQGSAPGSSERQLSSEDFTAGKAQPESADGTRADSTAAVSWVNRAKHPSGGAESCCTGCMCAARLCLMGTGGPHRGNSYGKVRPGENLQPQSLWPVSGPRAGQAPRSLCVREAWSSCAQPTVLFVALILLHPPPPNHTPAPRWKAALVPLEVCLGHACEQAPVPCTVGPAGAQGWSGQEEQSGSPVPAGWLTCTPVQPARPHPASPTRGPPAGAPGPGHLPPGLLWRPGFREVPSGRAMLFRVQWATGFPAHGHKGQLLPNLKCRRL